MKSLDYKIHLFKGMLYRRLCRFLPVQINVLNKMNIFLDSKYAIVQFTEIFASRAYYPALELFKNPPKSILDLGAHAGFFTLLVETHIGQRFPDWKAEYSLYEAYPPLIKKIKRNLDFADLDQRYRIYCGAVGKRDGFADFGICKNLHCSSIKVKYSDGIKRYLRVPYLDIEKNLLQDSLQIPQLVKIDIEGAEVDLVQNYKELFSKICVAVFEFHGFEITVDKWHELVAKTGLQLQEVTEHSGLTFTEIFINRQNLIAYNNAFSKSTIA